MTKKYTVTFRESNPNKTPEEIERQNQLIAQAKYEIAVRQMERKLAEQAK